MTNIAALAVVQYISLTQAILQPLLVLLTYTASAKTLFGDSK